MKVRIVCYEDVNAWILGKFARKLNEELNKLGVDSDIGKIVDSGADINHHIIYLDYNGPKSSIDTLMVTHVDTLDKTHLLKKQLMQAEMGICMSSDTMNRLPIYGLNREKLCYINPAHDGIIKPRPEVVGIMSKVHADGRKFEDLLVKLCNEISPNDFAFIIMGYGWEKIISIIKTRGFMVEYYDVFDYKKYVELMPSLDYYLYFSNDEGSMGFIDALSAGVKTIVTPQGYHLDAEGGITYPVSGLEDLIITLNKIAEERRKLIDSVKNWTWENYAKKHIQIWEYLLDKSKYLSLLANNTLGKDGITSIKFDRTEKTVELSKLFTRLTLLKNSVLTKMHLYFAKLFQLKKIFSLRK